MKHILSIFIIILAFTSCEKKVDLKYKDNPSRIIIEGNINNGAGPYLVKISKSVSLTSTEVYPTVNDAVVTISDDAGNSEALNPQRNGSYSTVMLGGVPGRTYTLTVQASGQTYTAQSTMPEPVLLDSIKIEKIVSTGETEYNLIPVYRDPVTKGNSYRFVVSVNNKLLNQHFIQTDEVRNGEVNSFRLEVNTDDITLEPGDSIAVAMQCIDKKVAVYYTALALMADSGPGGDTTPNNPPGNISNGVLGLFSAHTVQAMVVVLP